MSEKRISLRLSQIAISVVGKALLMKYTQLRNFQISEMLLKTKVLILWRFSTQVEISRIEIHLG